MSTFNASKAADLALKSRETYDDVVAPNLSEEQAFEVEVILADRRAEQARAALSRAFVDGTPDDVVDDVAAILPVLAATMLDHAKSRENAMGREARTVRLVTEFGAIKVTLTGE